MMVAVSELYYQNNFKTGIHFEEIMYFEIYGYKIIKRSQK